MSMVKNFKNVALAAALVAGTALGASGAMAAHVIDNQIDPSTGGGSYGATFTSSEASFTDVFSFYFGPGGASSTVTSSVVSKSEVNFTSIFLDGFAFSKLAGGVGKNDLWNLDPVTLTSGWHTITLKGSAVASASKNAFYDGNITLDAVPEPATWGMMLVGFGLVGAGMRSRKRSMVLA
jgi:PEP-CTERM putative exosortase interaction domain